MTTPGQGLGEARRGQLEKIAEGREAEIFAWDGGRVLRLLRNTDRGQSATREAAAMRAARSVLAFVPRVYDTVELDGRQGLIMERADGSDLMARIGRRPWTVFAASSLAGRVHAQLHSVRAPDELPPLRDTIRTLVEQTGTVPAQLTAFVINRLDELPDGDRLCHGDFHPGNVIMTARGPMVIDWAWATRGDPTADFARTLLMMRAGALPPGSPLLVRAFERAGRRLVAVAYARSYRQTHQVDMALVQKWIIVRAADRVAANVPQERPKLLRVIERAYRAAADAR